MNQLNRNIRQHISPSATSLVLLAAVLSTSGCAGGSEETFGKTMAALAGQVGVSCVLDDEFHTSFSGFSSNEVVLSSGDECSVGNCLAYHFQGRVSCPEGQSEGGAGCTTPDGAEVSVPVEAQVEGRRAEDGVFCSCGCDGEGNGPFCACPSGYVCESMFENLRLAGVEDLADSYCVPE